MAGTRSTKPPKGVLRKPQTLCEGECPFSLLFLMGSAKTSSPLVIGTAEQQESKPITGPLSSVLCSLGAAPSLEPANDLLGTHDTFGSNLNFIHISSKARDAEICKFFSKIATVTLFRARGHSSARVFPVTAEIQLLVPVSPDLGFLCAV